MYIDQLGSFQAAPSLSATPVPSAFRSLFAPSIDNQGRNIKQHVRPWRIRVSWTEWHICVPWTLWGAKSGARKETGLREIPKIPTASNRVSSPGSSYAGSEPLRIQQIHLETRARRKTRTLEDEASSSHAKTKRSNIQPGVRSP